MKSKLLLTIIFILYFKMLAVRKCFIHNFVALLLLYWINLICIVLNFLVKSHQYKTHIVVKSEEIIRKTGYS